MVVYDENSQTIEIMALEIERKFLVSSEAFRTAVSSSTEIAQGYLSSHPDATVRVRVRGSRGYLTVKSRNCGAVRSEWEYEVPVEEAREMLRLCGSTVLRKVRHLVEFGGHTWEVDEFIEPHAGLILAEVELQSADEAVELPEWIGREVTGDSRYYNSVLAGGTQR
jgi:adenylate cyclase